MDYTVGQFKAITVLVLTVVAALCVWLTTALGDEAFPNLVGSTVEAVQSLSTENPLVTLTSEARELRRDIDGRHAALYEASLDMDGFEPVP